MEMNVMKNIPLLIIFLVLIIVLFSVLTSKSLKFKDSKTSNILYVLVTGLLIGAGGLFGYKYLVISTDSLLFYILIPWMLALGIFHLYLSEKILPWVSKSNFGSGLMFSLANALAGAVFMLLAFHIGNHKDYTTMHLASLIVFLLPFLFYSTFKMYLDIPVKIFRKWYYPVDQHVEDPQDRELESPLGVAFDFKKKAADEHVTSFRAKAPKEMVFGKLFYYFINDYNDRNPDEAIEYLVTGKKPFGWIFYFKPKWFSKIRYLDPEETNSNNLIKENSIIVCKRVIEN
jgi:hypothetical protein